ncbi:MAG: type I 3-dehydroquinate dehydratase [Candidatus Bathyarchaeia archaeon]
MINLRVRICTPIPARDFYGVINMIHEAEACGADLVEARLDYIGEYFLENINRLKDIVKASQVPIIATNRHRGQGGICMLSEEHRVELLLKAAEAGFTYVDIELDTQNLPEVVNRAKDYGAKVIVSHHIFSHTPSTEELEATVRKEVESGADICKVITMANSFADSIKCLMFTYKMSRGVDLVCFAMGGKGILSRVLSPVFGASFTYASLKVGFETAPGQITIHEMREIYRGLRLE